MKIKTLCIGFLLLAAMPVFGQSNKSDSRYNKETEKVEAAVHKLFTAMVEKNSQVLGELTAEKLDYGHSSGTLENKSQFIDAVMNGGFDYISIDPEQQQVTLSGKTAIVRHIFVSKGTNNGEAAEVRIGNLMTFQKQKSDWKLLARQAYKL